MSTTIKKHNVALAKQGKPGLRSKTVQEKDASEAEKKKQQGTVVIAKSTRTREVVAGRAGPAKVISTSVSSVQVVKKQRVPNSPTSNRVTKSQYFPGKSLYSNALTTHGVESPRIKPALPEHSKSIRTTRNTKNVTNAASSSSSVRTPKSRAVPLSKTTPKAKPKPTLAEVKRDMREKLKKVQSKSPDSSSSSQIERPKTATLKRPSIVKTNIAGPEVNKLLKLAKSRAKYTDSVNDTSSIPESVSTNADSEFDDTEIHTNTNEDDDDEDDNYEDDFDSYASDFEEYKSSDEKSQVTANSSDPEDLSTEGQVTSSDEEAAPEETPKRVNSAEDERKLDSGNFDLPEEGKHVQILGKISEIKEVEAAAHLSSLSDEGFEEAKSSLQFVNFKEARKKQKIEKQNQRMNKRGSELMGMIRLDQQNFTLFNLPGQSYDEFIKSFGNRNSSQVASQTGDDRIEEEVQTEEIVYSNKWTQFPIDKLTKSMDLKQLHQELRGVGGDNVDTNDKWDFNKPLEFNEYNLKKFLIMQEKLIGDLLNESQHTNTTTAEMTTGKFPFSQGYLVLNTEKYSPTNIVTFSTSSKNLKIITVHEMRDLKCQGFVWSLMKPNVPEDNFTAFGEITDITFGLDNDKLIFGGFKNGSLAVWDLLEDTNSSFRAPSFLTDLNSGLLESIVKIKCFQTIHSKDFQVITLDEIGTIVIWGLILKTTDSLGMNRISLVRNNSIHLRHQHADLNLLCTDLCLNVNDPNHLYISTNYGLILHSLVTGAKTNPRRYNAGVTGPINVLESCPQSPNYFLAGCQTGEVVLVAKQFEKPLMTISNQQSDGSILSIQWSHNRPCIFYTHDSNNNINVWNFSVSELFPTVLVHLKEGIKKIRLSPKQSEVSYMAIITNDGKVHLHLLNQEHGMQEIEVYAGDLRKFTQYVQRL